MVTGFSATTVNPQATGPHDVPRFSVAPSTIFNARRKNTGGFSRASCGFTYITPGQLVLLIGAVTVGAAHTELGCSTVVRLVPFHNGATVQLLPPVASG